MSTQRARLRHLGRGRGLRREGREVHCIAIHCESMDNTASSTTLLPFVHFAARCVSIWYIFVTLGAKRSDGPGHPSVGRSMVRDAAPAAMTPPTEAREGCSGLVGDACARQLDGGVDGRRPPYGRDPDPCTEPNDDL